MDFLDAVSSDVTSLIGDVSYLPFGPANVVTFGNGRTLSKTYDKDYAIDAVTSSDAAGLTIDASVDVLGNLINASSTLGATPPTRSYQYDPLYRLNGVTNSSAATLEAYSYDQTGDRLSKTFNGTAQSYAYPSPLTSHRLQSVAGTARSYDANGNTSAIGSTTFTYDDRNRLTSSGGVNYGYNGRGERVMKSSATLTDANLRFAYSSNGQLLAEYRYGLLCVSHPPHLGCSNVPTWIPKTEYLWLDGTLVGVAVNGTPFLGPGHDPTPAQLYYVETDQLGTPRAVVQPGTTTASDTVVWTWDYFASAFGENAPNPDPDGDSTNFVFNLRYPGQYFDQETGLNYNYFRDYEPGTGRYVESDPSGLDDGTNTYAYVRSRPLRLKDPFGLTSLAQCANPINAPVCAEAASAAAGSGAGFSPAAAAAGVAAGGILMSSGDSSSDTTPDPDEIIDKAPVPPFSWGGTTFNPCACTRGRQIVEPSRSPPGGISIEQEFICAAGSFTWHIIYINGHIVHNHFRPGSPKGGGGD